MKKLLLLSAVCLLSVCLLSGCGGASGAVETGTNKDLGTENGGAGSDSGALSGGAGSDAGSGSVSSGSSYSEPADEATIAAIVPASLDEDDNFSKRDFDTDYDETEAEAIHLLGSSIESDSENVAIDGCTVTIQAAGDYIVDGSMDSGMLVVDAGNSDNVRIILSGADITMDGNAAVYVKNADKVFVTLAEGSENSLTSLGEPADEDIDAALWSKQDLTINGSGALSVYSETGHGIRTKDELAITSGAITVEAAGHGLRANESIAVADGFFTITAGKDGIHAEADEADEGFVYIRDGSFTIVSEGDAISASGRLEILDGFFGVVSGEPSFDEEAVAGTLREDGGVRGGAATPGGERPEDDGVSGGMERPEIGDLPDGGIPGGGLPWGSEMPEGRTRGGRGGEPGESDIDINNGTSEDSTSTKGLKSDTDLIVRGGSFEISSEDDALHAVNIYIVSGDFVLSSEDDACHADEELCVLGGDISIGWCYEGLEGASINIYGGSVSVHALDDGLGASGEAGTKIGGINIYGGDIRITADIGDGLDSNGDILIAGGFVVIDGAVSNVEVPIDYVGNASISGGTLLAIGGSGMFQSLQSDTQGVIALTLGTNESGAVSLCDEAGNTLVEFEPEKSYSAVIVSSPEIESGGSYTLACGDSERLVTLSGFSYSDISYMRGGGGMAGGRGDIPDGGGMAGGMERPEIGDVPDNGMPEGGMPEADGMPGGDMKRGGGGMAGDEGGGGMDRFVRGGEFSGDGRSENGDMTIDPVYADTEK